MVPALKELTIDKHYVIILYSVIGALIHLKIARSTIEGVQLPKQCQGWLQHMSETLRVSKSSLVSE